MLLFLTIANGAEIHVTGDVHAVLIDDMFHGRTKTGLGAGYHKIRIESEEEMGNPLLDERWFYLPANGKLTVHADTKLTPKAFELLQDHPRPKGHSGKDAASVVVFTEPYLNHFFVVDDYAYWNDPRSSDFTINNLAPGSHTFRALLPTGQPIYAGEFPLSAGKAHLFVRVGDTVEQRTCGGLPDEQRQAVMTLTGLCK